SSPGSGKTSLFERTLEGFAPETRVAVVTGDIQTDNDARRLARFGFPVRQINTAGACHLDARMVEKSLKYPGGFAKSRLMVLNKIDLLPYVPCGIEAARRNARSIHADIDIIE